VELEARTADWLDPAHLSPDHAKLLQHLTADRGLTLESLAREWLKELQAARGTVDPQVEADFGPAQAAPPSSAEATDGAADWLKEIQQIQKRNTAGGNRRVVG